MKVRSSPILGLICMGSILAMDTKLDCKDLAMSGLMDAMWFSAAVAASEANTQAQIANSQDEMEGRLQPGADGKDGQDGQDGADGQDGKDGKDGKDGQDGLDGKDGQDGQDGQNGQDLTGVIARGWIPGADFTSFPLTVGATYVPAAGKAVGILSAYRPVPEAGNPAVATPGEYVVRVQLPQRDDPYTRDELAVILSVEARRLGPEPGPIYQLFGYWQILPSSLNGNLIVGDVVELRILIKAGLNMVPADGNFSIVVMAP